MSVNNVFNLAAWTLKAVYISQFVDTLFGPNGLDFESVSSYFFYKSFFKKKNNSDFPKPISWQKPIFSKTFDAYKTPTVYSFTSATKPHMMLPQASAKWAERICIGRFD